MPEELYEDSVSHCLYNAHCDSLFAGIRRLLGKTLAARGAHKYMGHVAACSHVFCAHGNASVGQLYFRAGQWFQRVSGDERTSWSTLGANSRPAWAKNSVDELVFRMK